MIKFAPAPEPDHCWSELILVSYDLLYFFKALTHDPIDVILMRSIYLDESNSIPTTFLNSSLNYRKSVTIFMILLFPEQNVLSLRQMLKSDISLGTQTQFCVSKQ